MNLLTRPIAIGAGIALALSLAALTFQSVRLANERAAHSQTRTDWADERASASQRLVRITDQYRTTEQALATTAETERKTAHEDAADRDRRHADMSRRLLIAEANAATAALLPRPTPPAGAGARPAPGGDGAELPVTYGQEDVDEARRAEQIRSAYLSCRRQYNDARERLAALTAPD